MREAAAVNRVATGGDDGFCRVSDSSSREDAPVRRD